MSSAELLAQRVVKVKLDTVVIELRHINCHKSRESRGHIHKSWWRIIYIYTQQKKVFTLSNVLYKQRHIKLELVFVKHYAPNFLTPTLLAHDGNNSTNIRDFNVILSKGK